MREGETNCNKREQEEGGTEASLDPNERGKGEGATETLTRDLGGSGEGWSLGGTDQLGE